MLYEFVFWCRGGEVFLGSKVSRKPKVGEEGSLFGYEKPASRRAKRAILVEEVEILGTSYGLEGLKIVRKGQFCADLHVNVPNGYVKDGWTATVYEAFGVAFCIVNFNPDVVFR